MKYILMMHCPRNGYDSLASWPKEDIQAHIGFMMSLNKGLRETGELVSAEGLASPKEAKRVRAGKDGAPITDGVFPEAKEFSGGLLDRRRREPRASLCHCGARRRQRRGQEAPR